LGSVDVVMSMPAKHCEANMKIMETRIFDLISPYSFHPLLLTITEGCKPAEGLQPFRGASFMTGARFRSHPAVTEIMAAFRIPF
jgi:hypothetical protein